VETLSDLETRCRNLDVATRCENLGKVWKPWQGVETLARCGNLGKVWNDSQRNKVWEP